MPITAARKQLDDPKKRAAFFGAVTKSNRRRWTEHREKEMEHSVRGGEEVEKKLGKDHFSRMNQKLWADPEKKSALLLEVRDAHLSPEVRASKAAKMRKAWDEGVFENRDSYKGQHYDGIWMRSSYEVAVARCFDALSLTYKYEPIAVLYQHPDGTTKRYRPDFYVEEWNLYAEVKSDYSWSAYEEVNLAKRAAMDEAGVANVVWMDRAISWLRETVRGLGRQLDDEVGDG